MYILYNNCNILKWFVSEKLYATWSCFSFFWIQNAVYWGWDGLVGWCGELRKTQESLGVRFSENLGPSLLLGKYLTPTATWDKKLYSQHALKPVNFLEMWIFWSPESGNLTYHIASVTCSLFCNLAGIDMTWLRWTLATMPWGFPKAPCIAVWSLRLRVA